MRIYSPRNQSRLLVISRYTALIAAAVLLLAWGTNFHLGALLVVLLVVSLASWGVGEVLCRYSRRTRRTRP